MGQGITCESTEICVTQEIVVPIEAWPKFSEQEGKSSSGRNLKL